MIVVTGATGHIGNVLIRELVARGQNVRALVLPGDDCLSLAGLNTELVYGDVTDLTSLESAFARADIVFHLAGIVTIATSMKKVLEQWTFLHFSGLQCSNTWVSLTLYSGEFCLDSHTHEGVLDFSRQRFSNSSN